MFNYRSLGRLSTSPSGTRRNLRLMMRKRELWKTFRTSTYLRLLGVISISWRTVRYLSTSTSDNALPKLTPPTSCWCPRKGCIAPSPAQTSTCPGTWGKLLLVPHHKSICKQTPYGELITPSDYTSCGRPMWMLKMWTWSMLGWGCTMAQSHSALRNKVDKLNLQILSGMSG